MTKTAFKPEVLTTKLAQSRYGRVLLHLSCLAVRPNHLSWHWHGILRELAKITRRKDQMKNTLIASLAGLALLTATSAWAQASHVSGQFHGTEVNTGRVTHSMEGNKNILTLSDDFKVPKGPDLHWQVVDSKGETFMLQRLLIKGGTLKGDKLNKSITVPAYVSDISKVQIYCAYVEMSLGEASFETPIQPTGR
jgi:hypothetical protein